MQFLLIDNSNTRTKFALADGEALCEWSAWVATAELSPESLDRTLHGVSFDAVMLCSVVPQKAAMMADYFHGTPFHALSHESNTNIQIDYPNPAQIGADRLANAMAVCRHHSSPAIVIDFGTAVTFDVIGANCTYLGGVITPGLASMTENLAKRTALLPKIQLEEPQRATGKSTTEAMLVGAVYGYRGMVKEIVHKLSDELESAPLIIATGGDAGLIAQGIDEIAHVDPTLTLSGLLHAAHLHYH
ncbi:type III pantothenate kinase [Rubritalea marina]|uniref:type III pantothenate kinase n=1 Tax=Rubritalea marina TaxID=361055 RepID=UPI000476352D|nr:type III pantothenate kinase [Rubritalea marina]